MHFTILAVSVLFSLASAENDYKIKVNLPALFGSHTSQFTFDHGQCRTLERSLWINWMSISPGDDYYRCAFYDSGDCSGREINVFTNKPGSPTVKKEIHVGKGKPQGNSLMCKALK